MPVLDLIGVNSTFLIKLSVNKTWLIWLIMLMVNGIWLTALD